MKARHTPSDWLQHIQFEGCDVCVIAPEDYDALVVALEKYGQHAPYCMSRLGPTTRADCDCGFRVAIKAIKGEA